MASLRKASPILSYGSAIVQIGLAALVIVLGVRAALAFMAPESLWEPEAVSAGINPAQQSARQNFVFTSDPFHRESAPTDINIGVDAPETTLNLKLVGLRFADKGTAILQTPDNKQGVYEIGDEIINGVILKSMTPEYIVLSLDGRLERLTFAARQKKTMMNARRQTQMGKSSFDVKDFMRDVRFEKIIDRGTVKGFVVTRQNPQVDISKYGLKSGDLVTAIGDVNLTKANINWADIAAKMSRARSADITLQRRGKTMTVKVSM